MWKNIFMYIYNCILGVENNKFYDAGYLFGGDHARVCVRKLLTAPFYSFFSLGQTNGRFRLKYANRISFIFFFSYLENLTLIDTIGSYCVTNARSRAYRIRFGNKLRDYFNDSYCTENDFRNEKKKNE